MIAALHRLVWSSWRPIAERAARAYVAGPELGDALRVCRALAHQEIGTTICRWDGDGESAQFVADSYLAALEGVRRAALDCYLSIKAPSLGYSRDLLGMLLEFARPQGIGIHFDALAPETADATWRLIREAVVQRASAGCTLPARWSRSVRDVDQAVELGLRVRVVKGQWDDGNGATADVRKNFLTVVKRLAGRAHHVAVATHDPPLARAAIEHLRAAGTACEVELLYGLPARDTVRMARAACVPVRFYVPYGHAWLPYCLSHAKRHPRIVWWTMRDWMLGWRWPAVPR
jgi:proline dehydrogenase